jgi:hypothetical protein
LRFIVWWNCFKETFIVKRFLPLHKISSLGHLFLTFFNLLKCYWHSLCEPYGGTPRSQIKLKHWKQLINFCVGSGCPVAWTIQTWLQSCISAVLRIAIKSWMCVCVL